VKRTLFLASIFAVIIISGLFFSPRIAPTIEADTTDIEGFAWSSNIGWISFNGANYGVSIDEVSGTLSGYAWSSNIGWISFNTSDLIGCPTSPCRASYDDGDFLGWAKAMGADGHGWDGWIHISGTNYGLTYDDSDGSIDGFSWGGPVVGWITPYNMTTDITDSCHDGLDNDGDGLYDDIDDPDCVPICSGCTTPPPGTETVPNPQCNNGKDDDGDSKVDYPTDPGCYALIDNSESDSDATPIVDLKVGINSPSFESLNLGKGGGNVVLGIEIDNAAVDTTCTRSVTSDGNTTNTNINTGGAASHNEQQSLTVTERTRVTVSCSTGGLTSSDSIEILIKDEDEI
jgi:hypothetical protein